MIKKITLSLLFILITTLTFAQKYEFKTTIDLEASKVKSQGLTGTCWSFSTTSFLESEVFRITKKNIDLSEMYTVRNIYEDKAWDYVMRQGKIQFGQGGLAHDVINSVKKYGIVPEVTFSGVPGEKATYNHSKLVPQLKKILDSFIKSPKTIDWKKGIHKVLDKEIGVIPTFFNYEGKTKTPKSFAKELGIDPDNYVTITSFTHKKPFEKFVLQIPDNFSCGSMTNVSLEDFENIVDHALKKGFTVALDIDVSEKTFSAKYGVAFIPESENDNKKGLKEMVLEKKITKEFRQQEFENYDTTDDHLMHIVGLVKDQKGNEYYKVKNSWGSNVNELVITDLYMLVKLILN